MSLPPLYYGTVDATPLWVCLLHDAWRAGLDERDVEALLPALEAALGWLTAQTDPASGGVEGFVRYVSAGSLGLANQGWKDSGDAVRFADGTFAEGAIALCEVQGYAYEAAVSGAALLDGFDRPGGDDLRTWAQGLQERFRASFWCGTADPGSPDGPPYPALALDGTGSRVDALTSNIGHLVGTGLLNLEEEWWVARRVASPALDSGLGLRTMSTDDAAYAPLSYHCGSVWPHDTAIVVDGLTRAGPRRGRRRAGRGSARRLRRLRPAPARAVERRGCAGPLPRRLPPAGLERRRGRRRGPAGRGVRLIALRSVASMASTHPAHARRRAPERST